MNLTSITTVKGHMAWLKNKRRFLVRHGEIIALGLLIALVSLINILWIMQDTRPQPDPDSNIYLIKTYLFVDKLKAQGGTQFWQSVAELSMGGGRPPLYQLLSLPFIYLFGRSADAALLINMVFTAILLLCTYGIGRFVLNGKAGLLAALLVATYPPIVGLSRIYRPHSVIPAWAALSLWLLLFLLKTRSVKIAWLFGASLGFGMLIQLQFLYLLPAPTVLFGLYMLLFQTDPKRPPNLRQLPRWVLTKLRDPFALYGLLPAALIATGLTAVWYLPHSQTILALPQKAAVWSGMTRGFTDTPSSFWWYALTAPGALSTVLAGLLVIGLVIGTIKRRLGFSVLAMTFLIVYCGFGLTSGVKTWIYFASALPVAAALRAIGVVEVRNLIFPSRTGPSRIMCVTKVNRSKGQISVEDFGRSRLWRAQTSTSSVEPWSPRTKVDGRALRLRLPADTALWDAIEQGTPLQITPKTDAAGNTVYSVRLAPGTHVGRLLSTALTVVCVVVAVFNFSIVTWGVGPWGRPIAIVLGAPLDSRTCLDPFSRTNAVFCPNPARQENWRADDILRVILDDPGCQTHKCHLAVVPRTDTFGHTIFFHNLVRDYPQSYQKIGMSRADWMRGGASYNAKWLASDYLVYIPQVVTGTQFQVALQRFLESPPAVFANAHQEVVSFALPGGWTVKLVKRTAPLTLEEARLSIAALRIPEDGKSMMLRDVRKQFENEGN